MASDLPYFCFLEQVAEESSGVRWFRDETVPGRLSRSLAARPGRRAGPPRMAAQKKSVIATERDTVARQAWHAEITALDPARLVFLDETATPTSMTRLHARAPRGERAIGAVSRRGWRSVAFVARVRPTGRAPAMLLDGAVNRDAFEACVEQLLLPTIVPGQI